ncbi:GNAT family N-acetyltransferase [Candidatus Woesearchaeota archaeon]|nr:GNAT family N-acetyltransferase [Candidatus Woesearchaeota archaeon]
MVRLEKFTEKHITPEYLEAMNNEEHMKYMALPSKWSREDVLQYLRELPPHKDFYALYVDGSYVGTTTHVRMRGCVVVGYLLFPRHAGKGILRRYLENICFDVPAVLGIVPENKPSLISALKSGFTIYSFAGGPRPELWLRKEPCSVNSSRDAPSNKKKKVIL